MFLIRRDLLLRKKPGHGRRHADDDDVPILSPLVSAYAHQPLTTPRRRLARRRRLVTVIIFFFLFFFFLFVLPILPFLIVVNLFYSFFCFFYYTRVSFSTFTSYSLFPLLSPPPCLLDVTMLHRIFSRSHLLKERHIVTE